MPEGPEVKVLVDYLNKNILGNKIEDIKIISGKYTKQKSKATTICGFNDIKKSLPLKIKGINCYGKFIYWELEDDWYCFITLGLTGRVLVNVDTIHKRVEFITNKNLINFSDMRNFGTIHFFKGKEQLEKKLKTLGVDMLNSFNLEKDFDFIEKKLSKIKNQKKKIGEVLLEQRIFAGSGNYVRAETLYRAGISPFTEIKEIKGEKLKKLLVSMHEILIKSYKSQLKCLNKNGYHYESLTGCYDFQVYRRKETPKGEEVFHEKLGQGRMIWYVK